MGEEAPAHVLISVSTLQRILTRTEDGRPISALDIHAIKSALGEEDITTDVTVPRHLWDYFVESDLISQIDSIVTQAIVDHRDNQAENVQY